MQKLFWALIWIGFAPTTEAQYYYSDLIGIRQVETKQQRFKTLHVRQILGTAVLPTGEVQTDFKESYEISFQADTLQQIQVQAGARTNTTLIFSKNGQLAEQMEKRAGFTSQITYSRNKQGYIDRIENRFSDSLSEFQQREIHLWSYNATGSPLKMWRILEKIDGVLDSTEIQLTIDSTGLVTEERSFKRGRETGFFYYYYNESGQITDIVRFNSKFNRLLPDQLFEYDAAGNMTQRMQLTGSRDVTYLIFRYGYQTNGLLSEETLFNNRKEHQGSIRFSYLFR
jgi:hypothetical protein